MTEPQVILLFVGFAVGSVLSPFLVPRVAPWVECWFERHFDKQHWRAWHPDGRCEHDKGRP